jgi:hypothetical protein
MSGFWPIGYFPKRTSAQRFDEAPKLDSRLGSGTVPVIAMFAQDKAGGCCSTDQGGGKRRGWALRSITSEPGAK